MFSKSLIAATAKPIILSLLLSGESYGYQILKRVRKVTDGKIAWSSAMLYPVLHRLAKDGLIQSEWKISEEGRMRKYYFLTKRGQKELEAEKERWLSIQQILAKLWTPAEAIE
jgi:DNA-binding PadR family transcriptional regulator